MIKTALGFALRTAPVVQVLLENFIIKSMTAMEWTVVKIDSA